MGGKARASKLGARGNGYIAGGHDLKKIEATAANGDCGEMAATRSRDSFCGHLRVQLTI